MLTVNFKDTNLNKILSDIANGEIYIWSILYIDVVFKPDTKYSLNQIVKKSLEATGYIVSFSELLNIAEDIHDIYDILIIGVFEGVTIPDRNSDIDDIVKKVEVMIEGFDSSYWNINQK